MNVITKFINKSVSLLRLGNQWYARLLASLMEAGRTISYVETTSPSQSDTLHKELKWCDEKTFKKAFEGAVRKALKLMRLGPVKVAIDVTEEPYWGKNGTYNTRAKVHEKSDESWQYINLSIVEPKFIPLMSLPYRQIDNLDLLAIELLEYLRALPLRIKLVLFDRGFYHAHIIDYLENRRGRKAWPYLILAPKTKAVKRYLAATNKINSFKHYMNYGKGKSNWETKTIIVICKGIGKDKNGKPIDWSFATNQRCSIKLVREYRKRWNIETGFRIQDEAKIKSKSSHPMIRYFYHLLSMLIILRWRLHNRFEKYMVFKRYLKYLEWRFSELTTKPPPWLCFG